MDKFAIGDKVRAVENYGTRITKGQQYVVDRIDYEFLFIVLPGDTAPSGWYKARFEKVEEEEPMGKFKVGDRVKFVPKSWSPRFQIGKLGVVENHRTGEVAWPYSIRLDDSSLLSCVREDEIELVPAVTHAFKVGDKVVYKREPNVVYTILKLGERSDHYYISWISTFTGDHTKGEYELDNGNYKVVPEAPKLTRAKRQETALLKLHTELWDSRGTVIDDPDGFGYSDLRYKVLTGAIDSVVLALDALREEK